jgi:hypothetical protein
VVVDLESKSIACESFLTRFHALRGNAVFDTPCRLSSRPGPLRTLSVQDGIPTGTVGTSDAHRVIYERRFTGRTVRCAVRTRPTLPDGPHSEPYEFMERL